MADKIEDLNLPMAVISRLIKDALPPGAMAKQEAKLAIARAASVFVLFLTSAATDITSSQNQKTMTANHVLAALKDIEFNNFIPEIEQQLANFRTIMKDKKNRKSINESMDKNQTTEDVEIGDDDVE